MRLVGREREQERLRALLHSERRLISVTGRAGVGKSALLDELAASDPDGDDVWRVDLDGSHIAATTLGEAASRLGARGPAGEADADPAALFARLIGSSAVVLVLDHAEEGTDLAEMRMLLGACPRLRIILVRRTSVPGADAELVLPPLDVPDEGAPLDQAGQCDSIRLFVEIAARGDVRFRLDDDNVDSIVRICRFVGGLPLALELAAARVRVVPATRLAQDLEQSHGALDLLSGGTRAHHGGVRESLANTVGALSDADRRMLQALASFERDFTFGAATELSDRPAGDVADGVERLLDLRLLEARPPVFGEPVFAMLPVLRRLLAERGSDARTEATRRRMLTAILQQASEAQAQADRPAVRAQAQVLRRDLLVEADRLVTRADPGACQWLVDCAAALDGAAESTTVAQLLERCIATTDVGSLPTGLQARLWLWSSYGVALSPDGASLSGLIRERWQRGFDLVDPAADPRLALQAYMIALISGITTGDIAAAVQAATSGRQVAGAHAEATWAARFDVWIAAGVHASGDAPAAARLAISALGHAERVGDPYAVLAATVLLRTFPPGAVPSDAALPTLEDALQLARDAHESVMEWFILAVMTRAELTAGSPARAAHFCAMRLSTSAGRWWFYPSAISLVHTVLIATALGDWAFAARVLGAVEADRARVLRSMAHETTHEVEQTEQLLRSRLGAGRFAEITAQGGLLTSAEASIEAIRWLRTHSAAPDGPAPPDGPLTAREREVLELLADGLANKEIAARLHITAKTATHHSSSIYRKLAVRSRAEATAYAHRNGLTSGPPAPS